MLKKVVLFLSVLIVMFCCVACGGNNETTEYIIEMQQSNEKSEIFQLIEESFREIDSHIVVEYIELSEENKYFVGIQSSLANNDVVSILKGEDWIKSIQINYEMKMN